MDKSPAIADSGLCCSSLSAIGAKGIRLVMGREHATRTFVLAFVDDYQTEGAIANSLDWINGIVGCGFTLKSIARKTDIGYLKLVRLRQGKNVQASAESWEKLKGIYETLTKAGMIK